LTLRRPLLALILSLVIAFSFLGLIQIEKSSFQNFNLTAPFTSNVPSNNQFMFLTFPDFSTQPLFVDAAKETQLPQITNSTRAEVYNFIVANPGIQFRGICSGLGIAVGTAEFHLGVLKKAGLISFVRDGKYKRFFASKKFSAKEMKLISLLRHSTIKEIFKLLAAEKRVSHSRLASNLSITSQGLTWQINRLREEGVIQESFDGIKVSYFLSKANAQALPTILSMMK
jgi:DNA-binding transcriptional ArsR family regulator